MFQSTQGIGNGDCLSRLPIVFGSSGPEAISNTEAGLFSVCQKETLPIIAKMLAAYVRRESNLARLIRYANNGWRSRMDRSDSLYLYFFNKKELAEECGCLIFGWGVVVPLELHQHILSDLHAGQLGIVNEVNEVIYMYGGQRLTQI